jgi:hypothetical protein
LVKEIMQTPRLEWKCSAHLGYARTYLFVIIPGVELVYET